MQVIYGKEKNEVKECESLALLGEVDISGLRPDDFDSVQVSLENSNFKQAVEDLTTCLAKRLKALPEDSRYCFSDTSRFYCQADLYPGPLLRHIINWVLPKLIARTLSMPRRV